MNFEELSVEAIELEDMNREVQNLKRSIDIERVHLERLEKCHASALYVEERSITLSVRVRKRVNAELVAAIKNEIRTLEIELEVLLDKISIKE